MIQTLNPVNTQNLLCYTFEPLRNYELLWWATWTGPIFPVLKFALAGYLPSHVSLGKLFNRKNNQKIDIRYPASPANFAYPKYFI